MIRRMFISWLLLAVSVVGFTGLAGASSTDESSMVSLINSERAAHGLGTLDVYWDLVDDARAWTASMISDGYISHNPNLASVTTGWSTLGENVGVGPNVDRLHRAFMDSPGHKANILGNYNYVGIGADRSPDGNLYITIVFMLGPAGLVNPPTTTTTTPPTTTTTTPAPTTTTTTTTPPATAPTTSTTTTTVPSAAASPTTSTTQPRTASASPIPFVFYQTPTVAAGHVSMEHRVVYPCTKGLALASAPRMFCVN